MDFTIPTPLPSPPHGRNFDFEVPEHITPRKVHSTTGSVTCPQILCAPEAPQDRTQHCHLNPSEAADQPSSIILDFGVAVAGVPFLHISSIEKPAVIDVTLSESYNGILQPNGDGPFPFSPGADTLRRVRFRVAYAGSHDGRHVQGSQRWMKVTLVSGGPVVLSRAGFKPTTSNIPLDELPGFFNCSDSKLSELWGYGARSIQLNCIPERTVPSPWSVSQDSGVLVDSQRCTAYAWGGEWTDYTVEFSGMIIHDGLAWNCRVVGARPGLLFQLNLSKNEDATLEMWYGYYNKPQVTLVPTLLGSKKITQPKFEEGKWYRFKTVCIGDEMVSVYVDGIQIATFEQGNAGIQVGPELSGKPEDVPKLSKGSVGIGAGQDQVCRFRDLQVLSHPSGETLYASGLNNPACLGDFSLGTNQLPYIFDGAKRDRYAWTADIIIGGRALYYSTMGAKHVKGNLEASLLRTEPDRDGHSLLPGGVTPGREFERQKIDTSIRIMSVNYSLYTVMVIYDYWMYTGDHHFVSRYWNQIKGCLSYIEKKFINKDGLVEVYGREAGDYDYYNGLQMGVATKRNVLYVATLKRCTRMANSYLIKDDAAAKKWTSDADRTTLAIRRHLYSHDLNQFVIASDRTIGFQQETHAWAISEDILEAEYQNSTMEHFHELTRTTSNGAPLSFTPSTPEVPPVISPIMSAFQILATLHVGRSSDAEAVLRNVWEPMCDTSSPHYTGTMWEFMNPDLTPYSGDLCSYAQLFSTAPTFILSQYVLGVEAVEPGWKRFKVEPSFKISGVRWAQGRVPLPGGGSIEVRWEETEKGWRLDCEAPLSVMGTVVVPRDIWSRRRQALVNSNVWHGNGNVFEIDTGLGSLEKGGKISVVVLF